MIGPAYTKAAMQEVDVKIKRLGNYGKPQEDFLYSTLNEFMNGTERNEMMKAWDYFENAPDIKDKKRMVINRAGVLEETKVLTNSKLAHPFIKKLTKQKKDYLLKKQPSIKHPDEAVEKFLELYFNKAFHKKLKRVATDAIVKGKGWIQPYYNEVGELGFKRIPTEQVMAFWKDDDHTELDAVVRFYEMTHYNSDGSTEQIKKVEFYTLQGVWYYIMGKDGLIPDQEKGTMEGPAGHFQVEVNETDGDGNTIIDETTGEPVTRTVDALWTRIPMICFKYNAEELSLLRWVKTLIDDYDKNTSDMSDALQDTPNTIKVVKNYDGKDVETFNHNLNTYRTAFVGEDGDLKTLDQKIDHAAKDSHLDRLRKDIYTFGNGVDTQETDLGNASGVSLKFRTLDLSNDCEDMGTEFESSMQELAYFIMVDGVNKGLIAEFDTDELAVVFNTDTLMNEHEIINMAKASVGMISNETIVANHPWVESVSEEFIALEKQQIEEEEKELEHMKKMDAAFGTMTPNGSGE